MQKRNTRTNGTGRSVYHDRAATVPVLGIEVTVAAGHDT